MTTESITPAVAGPQQTRHCAEPRLDPALAHLSLATVRAYRQMLAQEEFTAGGWRRLIRSHLALLELWAGDLDPGSPLAGWLHQLRDLDHELVGYQECARAHLARVTDELIARYHRDPRRCLAALPLDIPARIN